MAQVNLDQSKEIKAVFVEAHRPDCTFKAPDNSTIASSVISPPVELLVIEIHLCFWDTTYQSEYKQFLKLIPHWDKSFRQQAIVLGFDVESHDKVPRVRAQIDRMFDEVIFNMPQWLADKCITLWEVHLKGGPGAYYNRFGYKIASGTYNY